ncbi:Serine-rich adhesin for platelets like [Actinidia chinensis var. chinensis]|uniref:Serine-rich adhesin for platelets like n=1 Tax=Actinidia chinensis var. chinensis TaxID=1590841 RepID=A0A2R6Q0Y8_ACTCC|nr:Serine-rich adhesin for platelets like [Actinidia chinensis var. chinensis]
MDFHSMQRKQLQALCKKHNIPANLTNLEMANKLAFLLKEKEKTMTRGRSCLKNLGEVVNENDSDGVNKQIKKVRFSPENEMFEFEGSRADYVETKRGKRRKSIINPVAKKGGFVTCSVDNIEACGEIMENPVRTRSWARKSLTGGIIPVDSPRVVKKRTRNVERSDSLEVRDGDRGDHLASAVEETMVTTRRSLRSRGVIREKSKEAVEDVAVLRKNQRVRSSKKKNVGTGDEIPEDSGLDADCGITQPEKALRRSKRNERKVKDYGLLNRVLGENEMDRKGRTTQPLNLWTDNASELAREMQIETEVKALGKLEVILQLEKPSKRNERKVKDHGIVNGNLVVNERARRGRTTRTQTLVQGNASAPERKVSNETNVEAFGKLEVVLQLEEPSRRKGRNSNRRESIMPQVEKVGTGGANWRSRRGGSRQELVGISDVMDETANTGKPLKRRRERIAEETVVTEAAAFAEEPPRRSTRIAAQTDGATLAIEIDKAVGREHMQSRSKHPNPGVEPLSECTLAIKEPPALNAEVSVPENVGSSITTVLNSGEVPNDKRFIEKSLSTEVSVETGDIEEAKALEMMNSVVSLASESVKLQNDHAEEVPLFSVGDAKVDKEEPIQDDTNRINEDDLESHSGKRSRESNSSNSFEPEPEPEPEEELNVSADVGSPLATSVDVGCSLVERTDCEAKPSDNLDVGKEMEGDEELDSPKHIDSSLVVAHHEVDDDTASVLKELKVVELEDSDSVGEPIKQEFVVENHLAKSNEIRGSKKNSENVSDEVRELSVLDISGEERIRSTQGKDKKTDDPEICAVGAEEQESAICSFRMQNITMDTLLTENVSASKGLPVTDPGSSELEVADGTSSPALSSSKKVSEDTNWKTKCSGRNSSLKKHHLMEACTESRDVDEIRGLIMVNLDGTQASSSVKLKSVSVEKERHILASESLVVPEKQNIVLVASNHNLFLGDMHKGTANDLASPSQIKSGDFEDRDISVVFTGTSFGADGFSPVPQAEHVAKPSSNLTFGDHLEREELSCKYTQSRGVTEADFASENDKYSVLEVQTFIEFQEVCRFSEPRTHDRVCESHSTGPSESEGKGEDFENTSNNAVDTRVLDPSHGEIITPNMVEQNNEEAELLEKISLSNMVTTKVVSEKMIDFQIASAGYSVGTPLTPLNALGCKGSPIGVEVTNTTEPAISIVNETQEASLVVNNELLPSSESTPLKDDSEIVLEKGLKTLFATPANNRSPTVSNMKNGSLNSENPQEVVGLVENVDEKMAHKRNTSPNASEEITNEDSDGTADVEFTEVDGSGYTGFDLFTSKDGDAREDEETDGSRFCGNASKEDTGIEVLQHSVEAGNAPILPERDTDKTDYYKETGEGNEFTAKSHVMTADTDCQCSEATTITTCTDLQYQAFGTSSTTEMSVSESRLSVENEREDEGTRSNSNDSVNAQVIQSAIVTEAKKNDESIEGDLHLEDSEHAIDEEKVEYLPEFEFGDSSDCKDQVNSSGDASLAETTCKESEVSEKKITTEFIKRTSECSNEPDLLEEGEKEGTLSPFDQLGISKIVLDVWVKSSIRDFNDLEVSDMLSDKDAKENVISAVSEADFDHKDSGIVFMEDTHTTNLEHGEMNHNVSNVDKDEVITELDITTSTVLEKLAKRQRDEDLVEVANKFDGAVTQVDEVLSNDFACHEIEMVQELDKCSLVSPHEIASADNEHGDVETSVDVAGTKPQVEEMKLDDLDSHKDGAGMEEKLNLVDNNSYAEDDVSQGYVDSCLDHEKVPKKASCPQLNVSDSDGKQNEAHVHTGDIGSDADGREVTEVEQDDLFDDCGFTVSSLVSTDCNEKKGSTPTSMNKSFQEDKDVGVGETIAGTIDSISSCIAEGPRIKENVKNKEKNSVEQSVGNEDAFVDGSDGLALINLFCGNETASITGADEVHGSWHNCNDTVHTNGDTKEHTKQQNFRGTMGYGAAELSLQSNMFSCWEIDMFLGDEVMNSTSEIHETHFACEDNTIVPEDQFDKHNQSMEAGKVAEINSTDFASNRSVFEGDEALNEAKEVTNKSNDCNYSENYLVEVEKSSIPMQDVILTEVSNPEGSDLSASVDQRVESGFKSSEEERVGYENALKSNPAMEGQSLQLDDLAATDRGELLNSTTNKRKNAETSRIQGTPMKLVTTLDMKENAPSIKRQNLDTTTVRPMTKRRALEELRKQ